MRDATPDAIERFFALSVDMLCIAHFSGSHHTNTRFSHGICPTCERVVGERLDDRGQE